ncbi:uncharacterized protein LOC141680798 [Apium graveolens]|uniref:uncharacterized protein LOC141680798 n=1 Tax=Apium graveolens TaxID=4045 RepID=UPI003D7A174A
MALAVIYQGVPEDILLTIADKETAKEARDTIKTLCTAEERLIAIVTNIRVLGEKVEEASVVRKILRVVPDKFLQIVSNTEQFGDTKAMIVEEVIGCLKAREKRIKGKSESVGGQLLLTKEDWAKRTTKHGYKYSNSEDESRDGSTKSDNNSWYLDNGANNHMTGHREKFSELNENMKGNVHFRDGSTVKIEGKGCGRLLMKVQR